MPDAPTAAEITLRQTLELLDGPFASFAAAVCEDGYAFWLGSGISLGRVEGLKMLIPRVLDHLQRRVQAGDPDCRFRRLLSEIFTLAALTDPERASINVEQAINSWPPLLTIVERLTTNYARFLDLAPGGEEPDYLIWEAVDVRATYASPAIEPDAEHLCLALLVLEGVVSDMPSANWDGLIERAVDTVAPGQAPLLVCVIGEDLRLPARQATLYKFHGCAVRARDNSNQYRPRLIGRASQINAWSADEGPIFTRLVDLATTRRTLMLGLSAQDGNIQSIFAAARASMAWGWPIDPPAYAFSEDRLGLDQQTLLQIVYRGGFTAATRDDILTKALVRAYAKPLLAALVLHVIFAKLERLLALAPSNLPAPERSVVAEGLQRLRNAIADAAQPPTAATVSVAVKHLARFMAMFHEGDATGAAIPYRPITPRAIQHLATDPTIPTAGMRELAVAIALTGMGIGEGHWSIETVDPAAPSEGACKLVSGGRASKYFVVANTSAAMRLKLNGHVKDDDDAIIVHGLEIAPMMARSPSPRRARTGAPGVREVSVAGLLADETTASELMQRFREEISA
jgi:SIR2-like domain